MLALAARRPAGLLGVVNVSGGVWRTTGEGNVCGPTTLVSAMATFGARTRVPSLWLYAENDSLFPPDLVNRMRDAYAKAGGRVELQMLPPILHDGHYLFADFSGRVKWLRALDRLSPSPPPAEHERDACGAGDECGQASRAERGPWSKNICRLQCRRFSSWPRPVPAPTGLPIRSDIDGARKRVLARCREKSGVECTVAMENNEVVVPP